MTTDSVQRPAEHLADFRHVNAFLGDHAARVLLQGHITVFRLLQQCVIELEAVLLVLQRLLENLVDGVLFRFQQLADLK